MPEERLDQLVSNIRRSLNKQNRAAATAAAEGQKAQIALETLTQEPDEEDGVEEGPRDLVPETEYEALADLVDLSPRVLKQRGINPRQCRMKVHRDGPRSWKGKRILTGLMPQYDFRWPFDTNRIAEQVGDELGGQDYKFVIYHRHKTIGSLDVAIGKPPINPPEAEDPEAAKRSARVPEAERIKEQIAAAEARRELAEREAERVVAEKKLERATAGEDIDDGDDGGEVAGQFFTEDDVKRMLETEREKMELRREMDSMKNEFARQISELTGALREGASKGGNGQDLSNLVSLIQQQSQQSMKGLEMVISNVGSQLSNVQQNNDRNFENMLKLVTAQSTLQQELAKVQMEGKNKELDLVVKMLTAKADQGDQMIGRLMEVLQMGMELGGKGGEKDEDWITKAAGALTAIISKQAGGGGEDQTEETRRKMREEIQGAVENTVAKMRAAAVAQRQRATQGRRLPDQPAAPKAAPPPPPRSAATDPNDPGGRPTPMPDDAAMPAPPEGAGVVDVDVPVIDDMPTPQEMAAHAAEVENAMQRRRAVVNELLALMAVEMDDRPGEAEFVGQAVGTLPEALRSELLEVLGTDDIGKVGQWMSRYGSEGVCGEIKAKMLQEKPRRWLVQQLGVLREALRQLAADEEGVE